MRDGIFSKQCEKKVMFSFHIVFPIKNTSPHVNREVILLHPFPGKRFLHKTGSWSQSVFNPCYYLIGVLARILKKVF